MSLLTPGYFPDTYFPEDYWDDNYWPDAGPPVVVPDTASRRPIRVERPFIEELDLIAIEDEEIMVFL